MAVSFGTRFLVILMLRAVAEYARHKVSIDTSISPGLKACLEELLTFVPEMAGLNEPGPE